MTLSLPPSDRTTAGEPCLVAARLAATAAQVPLNELMHTQGRDRRSVGARALAMYLAHVGLGLSMSRVARGFGRHRSTVAHACRRIEERREVAGWDDSVARLEDEARLALAGSVRREGGVHG